MSDPQILSERRKKSKIPQGARRDENRRNLNSPDSHPIFRKKLRPIVSITQNFALHLGNKTHPPPEKFQAERKSLCHAVGAAVWLVTLTKARPTHKHSQHSHSFSPYRRMVHGCFFCRALMGSRTILNWP